MFSTLRKRTRHPIRSITEPFGKAGLTVAILALVLAMVGGAWAAGALTSKQKKEVTKIAKKYAGKNGAPGATGPQGNPGAPGPKGDTGSAGGAGAAGKSVVLVNEAPPNCTEGGVTYKVEGSSEEEEVCKGEKGEPWTIGGTLPSGKTEYGSWNEFGETENGKQLAASISFMLPVENSAGEAPQAEFVYAKQTGTHCTGSASEPTAPAGYLCVYDAYEEEVEGTPSTHVEFLSFINPEMSLSSGVGKEGTLVHFVSKEIGSGGFPYTLAAGTWAVTAE